MTYIDQTDCFNLNIKFWKFFGIWTMEDSGRYYRYYSKIFVIIFIIFYDFLFSINFYFLPNHLDSFIEEMIFYFTELAVTSKVLTFFFMHEKIVKILNTLKSEMFQPITADAFKIIRKAKEFNLRYWKIVAVVSVTSNLTHVLSPFITHLILPVKLELPVCSYSFLSDDFKEYLIYPLYFYQSIGMHFHMWYNVNIDSFFLGLMILTIAQLEILNAKLQNVTDDIEPRKKPRILGNDTDNMTSIYDESDLIMKLNKSIKHFDEMGKFCFLIEEVFSVTLFIQFSMASCIVCVCLFRFTLPAPWQYYIFLATYMFIMVIQIMVPCWFGTRIIDKSSYLSHALYNCDWTPRSRRFKSNLRLFVERTQRPLSITGWKMFPLSLKTFTSIMNSAYSFFTLLRHMQSHQ